MIYKGYKYFNAELIGTKKPAIIRKCPLYREPNQNTLNIWEDNYREYFRILRDRKTKISKVKPEGPSLYRLWRDPGEQFNVINEQKDRWIEPQGTSPPSVYIRSSAIMW